MAAASTNLSCHVKKGLDAQCPFEHQSLAGERRGGFREEASATSTGLATATSLKTSPCLYRPEEESEDIGGPLMKKVKVHHSSESLAPSSESYAAAAAVAARRMPSPTDVRSDFAGGSQIQVADAVPSKCFQIKTLSPTLRGIIDAATVLRASGSLSAGAGKGNDQDGLKQQKRTPLLLSFPTESVYMLACCVRMASSRSIRQMLSRADSQASYTSSCSSERGVGDEDAVDPSSCPDPASQHGGTSLKDAVHPQNASLEWMIKCNEIAADDLGPLLFVLDGQHALNFCHFTKPKTFAIRPPSSSGDGAKNSVNKDSSMATAPSTFTSKASPKRQTAKDSSFSPLPVFGQLKSPSSLLQAPLTPKPTAGSTSPPSSPASPDKHKLCAANFSESREAFLRLASKFWPGPVVFHVRVRTLGGEDASASLKSQTPSSSAYSSGASLPSLLSTGDLAAAGNLDVVSVLSPSALIPASRLIPRQEEGPHTEEYFVAMQSPSHPLPRKILQEIYCGPASPGTVPYSASSESLASVSSMNDNTNGENKIFQRKGSSPKNGRARPGIAIMGCMAPGPKSIAIDPVRGNIQASGATTASAVDGAIVQSMSPVDDHEHRGGVFIMNGEENLESFSVPTCQYGGPHPVSLVIDGDNQTIHLLRRCQGQEVANESPGGAKKMSLLTKGSVYRALRKPASSSSNGQPFALHSRASPRDAVTDRKGDVTSIDRVITAVLSRWKIKESIVGS